MTTVAQPPLGLILAGGLARRMGGGDKARISIGGATILDRVLATHDAAMRAPHPQRQRRSGALRRHRPAGGRRRRAGFRRPARRHPRRARLGGGACARHRPTSRACRATARSCRATSWRGCIRRAPTAGTPLACARSGDWRHPVVGLWPVALRDDLRQALIGRRPAQDRDLDRAARRRHRRLAGRAGRSVLQRQHAGGRGGGRACCGAGARQLKPLIRRRRTLIISDP